MNRLFLLRLLANSAMMSTLTAHYQWKDETARERTGHPTSYAVANKIKSLTLHTHGCLRASLRDWSFSSGRLKIIWHISFSVFPVIIHHCYRQDGGPSTVVVFYRLWFDDVPSVRL